MQVPFLGRIPIDPALAASAESGKDFMAAFEESQTAKHLKDIVEKLS